MSLPNIDKTEKMHDAIASEEYLEKEVYARFGLAYYFSECVYRGLVQVIATADDRLTRPRVEEKLKALEEKTLGALVGDAKSIVPVVLHSALDWALAKRNFLAHGFWFERIHQLGHPEGMQILIEELTEDTEKFRILSGELDAIALPKVGITPDAVESIIEKIKHEPLDPLPSRSIPKRGSKLDLRSAWQLPVPGNALVFQDIQGAFWQLCDVGLGWSYTDGPKDEWSPCEVINKHLPAKVVARPKNAQPWNYCLDFSTGARLLVWWEKQNDRFFWKMQKGESTPVAT